MFLSWMVLLREEMERVEVGYPAGPGSMGGRMRGARPSSPV